MACPEQKTRPKLLPARRVFPAATGVGQQACVLNQVAAWSIVWWVLAAGWLAGSWQGLAAAEADWHLPQWQERAVVRIGEGQESAGTDTAAVRVLVQGNCQAKGEDFRLLTAEGEAVPFAVMFLDAARYAIVAFRVSDVGQTWYLYYGNPQAAPAAEQVVFDSRPGSGPPRGSWVPKPGLLLTTVARPRPQREAGRAAKDDNPMTVEELAAMLAASPGPHGARYQRRIADGYNPFGPSDYYMSIYRGWIQIPSEGEYAFCTASNEASFSFLDGKPLIHWPGRHTVDRGIHGEKHTVVRLTAGLHYIEYYHEEVLLQQMAFLGWRPPDAAAGPFQGIPPECFPEPLHAEVVQYERQQHPAPRFEPRITASLWPESRHEGQYTLVDFSIPLAVQFPADAHWEWQFGDGLTATGPHVQHVYLAVGTYKVVLTARLNTANANQAAGQSEEIVAQATWPLHVYDIQHVTEEIAEASPAELARLARDYDLSALDDLHLRELAHLLAEAGLWQEAQQACAVWLGRDAQRSPQWTAGMYRLAAECLLELGTGDAQAVVWDYLATLTPETPLAECCEAYARLLRLVGLGQDAAQQAAALAEDLVNRVRQQGLDEDSRVPYSRALAAMGDVCLWQGEVDEARRWYQEAEGAWGKPLPPQVRRARLGAFPDSVADYVSRGELGAAIDLLNKWEERFATERLHGQTFFWRGKIASLRGQYPKAVRSLTLAVRLGQGASFESEARWLLGEAYFQLGETTRAREQFARLLAEGFTDAFAAQARQRLAELRKAE